MLIIKIIELISKWKKQTLQIKFVFSFWVFLILALCAHPPFLIDNESYYIATVQWASEYGLVKGLANFHVFLAQTSGWHLLQAAFGFNLFGTFFYDLNGFVMILFVAHLLFDKPFKSTSTQNLCLSAAILMLFFVSSPSPDLILFIFTPLLILAYLKSSSEDDKTWFALIGICLFLIKPTAFFIVLFFIWDAKNTKYFGKLIAVSVFVLIIWVVKNSILSGWVFYPLPYLSFDFEWKLPEVYYNFQNTNPALPLVENWNPFQYFSKTMRLFHLFYFSVCLILSLYFLIKKNISYAKLMTLILLQWMVVVGIGGNLRFLYPCALIVLIFSFHIFKKETSFFSGYFSIAKITKLNRAFILLLFLFPFVVWFFIAPWKVYSKNQVAYHELSKFETNYFLFPANPSRFSNAQFEAKSIGNLKYYSPTLDSGFKRFLYGTYYGKIPTVNQKQLYYFKKRFGLVPQLRKKHVSDGFISVKVDSIKDVNKSLK